MLGDLLSRLEVPLVILKEVASVGSRTRREVPVIVRSARSRQPIVPASTLAKTDGDPLSRLLGFNRHLLATDYAM